MCFIHEWRNTEILKIREIVLLNLTLAYFDTYHQNGVSIYTTRECAYRQH
mgnify:CR=1 FL=1